MSEFLIKKATKRAKKLRLGLSAASGFGKTYTSLLLAKGLCKGDLSKTCVIDTERDSASLYSDLGNYDTLMLTAPFTPERYISSLHQVEAAGYEVVIIDSITHEWDGSGGCLEIQANLGGRYQDWKSVTPRHQAFIDAILNSPIHVITTVRRKQDYDMSKDQGKISVQKVGTREITRDGFEYELDINFEIINSKHLCSVSKDRSGLFEGTPDFVVTEDTGKLILEWLNKGKSNLEEAIELINKSKTIEDLTIIYNNYKDELGKDTIFIEAIKKKRSS